MMMMIHDSFVKNATEQVIATATNRPTVDVEALTTSE